MIQSPPKVITTKDHMYLKDALSWFLIAMKKCNHFAQEAESQDVRDCLNRIGQMHQRHYQNLLRHCQTNNQQGMTQIAGQMMQQQQQQNQQQNPMRF
jgi:hypothetical protein